MADDDIRTSDTQPPGADDGAPSIELARRARDGESVLLDQLVARHYEAVRAIVRRRLGAELRRYHESGDIVQEALVQAVRSFDRYDLEDEQAFLRWIAGVVENRLRDLAKFHRAQRRGAGSERRAGSIELTETGLDTPADRPGPATQVIDGDRRERVRLAIGKLDERTRRLIEARLDERPWAAIAEEFGFPSEGAARMAWSRALVAMSRELES
ncbi:MAG: sigma-70 family RNA polymerase sigma factor [Planctomycetota bacterium]